MSGSKLTRKISFSDWRSSLTSGREQFRFVFQNCYFADVKFIVGEKKEVIKSHSLVLKVRSSVFENLLEKLPTNTEGMKQIVVEKFQTAPVNKFIQFLYTDELEFSSVEETLEILYLAKKYKIQGLSQICASLLKSEINETNAATLFQSARQLKEIELEQKAALFFMSNAATVVEQEDFLNLDQFNLGYFVEKDELEIREIDLSSALIKWGKLECIRHKIQETPKHLRVVLKEALSLVRFPLMSKDDFKTKVAPMNILNERELVELDRYFDADLDNKQFVIPTLFSSKPRLYLDQEEQPDLTKQDEESHKRLAKFAIKNTPQKGQEVNSTIITVSNIILEIEATDSSVDLHQLAKEIRSIKKFGLYWGAQNIHEKVKSEETAEVKGQLAGGRLLIAFAADERRSYGVGSVIEEIQDNLGDSIKQIYARSFRDDIEVQL